MNNKIDANQSIETMGFRSLCNTCGHLETPKNILENSNQFNIKLFIAYIHYEKAFATVDSRYNNLMKKICIESKGWLKSQHMIMSKGTLSHVQNLTKNTDLILYSIGKRHFLITLFLIDNFLHLLSMRDIKFDVLKTITYHILPKLSDDEMKFSSLRSMACIISYLNKG